MKTGKTKNLKDIDSSLKDWQDEYDSLQDLLTVQMQGEEIRNKEISKLEENVNEIETELPEYRAAAEKVSYPLCLSCKYSNFILGGWRRPGDNRTKFERDSHLQTAGDHDEPPAKGS